MLAFLHEHNYKLSKHVTTNLIMAVITMMTSVFSYGFESSVLSTVQAMNAYERRFGELLDPATGAYGFTTSRLAFLNSFPLITYAVGVIGASFLGNRFGRRIVFLTMNTICLVGTALCFAGTTYTQALVGRMIVNIHIGAEAWLIPMWMAEIVPSAIRGSMVGLYAFSHILAGFIAAVITNATSKIEGDNSWRIPIGVMFAFPAAALLGSWLVPESPRWLLRRERFDEAVNNLSYLRCAGEDRDYPAEQEAQLIRDMITNAPTQGHWSEVFKGTNLRRTLTGCLAAGATQLTGQSFASTYGTVFLKQINVIDPFTGTMIKRAGLLCGCICVILLVDRIGRRRLCLSMGSVSAVCLLIMGGLGTVKPASRAIQNGILSMTIIFPCCYMLAFGSPMAVVMSEVSHTTLRDKAGMVFWLVSNISNFAATFTLPYLLQAPYANLGPKVGFLYGSTTTIFLFLIFFFVPEMTGKSLEEVDEMFESKIPAWRSKDFKSSNINSVITQIENGKTHGANGMPEKEHIEDVEDARN